MDKKKFSEKGQLIVDENYCCEHYEPDDGALVPMKECWCCKWSSFKTDNSGNASEGICTYLGNNEDAILKTEGTVIR